jgi:hypothetical protein
VTYEYTEYPPEPEPQPASSRGGRPPNKRIGLDVIDRPEISPPDLTRKPPQISFWSGIALLLGALLVLFLLGLASR